MHSSCLHSYKLISHKDPWSHITAGIKDQQGDKSSRNRANFRHLRKAFSSGGNLSLMIPYRHWKTYKHFRHWPPASVTENSSRKSVFPTVFSYFFLHLQPINHPGKDTWDVSGVYRKLLMCAAQRNIWYLGTRECPWDTRSRQGRVQP